MSQYLNTFRVILVEGARQAGKTTLVRDLAGFAPAAVLTFDDEATLSAARADPVGFVGSLPHPCVVDEYQRAGEGFLLAVKRLVDTDQRRGRLVLTGSTGWEAARRPIETLAGRVGRARLWPLSQGEVRGRTERFIDDVFGSDWLPPTGVDAVNAGDLGELLVVGGFPEPVTLGFGERARRDWFDAYVTDVVSKEALRPIIEVRKEAELRRVLRLLAARTAGELVTADVARDAGIDPATAAGFVALLEALHLVRLLPAWSTNATTRAKRHPKVHLIDTGLAADLLGVGADALGVRGDGRTRGSLFETLVTTELWKQVGWAERTIDLFHLRDRNGLEVDLLLEDRRTGEVVAIEAKATATPRREDARHIEALAVSLGPRLVRGVVVHAGDQTIRMGERCWAVPVSTLWA